MFDMPNKFSDWIEKKINERGWNFSELSRRSGLSPGTISDVLSERAQPGLRFCNGIASALNVPPETVLRKANLIPSEPEQTAIISEFVYMLSQLPEDEQEELLLIARSWIEARERKQARGKARRGSKAG